MGEGRLVRSVVALVAVAVLVAGCSEDDLSIGFAGGPGSVGGGIHGPGVGLVLGPDDGLEVDFEGSGSDLGAADTVARSDHAHAGLVIPSGTMSMFAGSTAPAGYLLCNGSAVSRTTYADLFAVIGTTYGVGDGSTTFNLPDMRGRVPVGLNAAQAQFDALDDTGGEISHTLTASELASHNHTGTTGSVGNHNHSVSLAGALDYNMTWYPSGGYYIPVPWLPSTGHDNGEYDDMRFYDGASYVQNFNIDWLRYQSAGSVTSGAGGTHNHGFTTGSTGSNTAHNNLQPYAVVNYIIKY